MIREIAAEKGSGISAGIIAARFMNTLIDMAQAQCLGAKAETGLNRIVMSGGVFQNMYLLERLPEQLRSCGFEVYTHSRVSANDEGLSLGQALVCEYLLENHTAPDGVK
jgi:hydrogenase maturation protein HypF